MLRLVREHARRPPKTVAVDAVREALANDPGPGIDRDFTLNALRELRGE